MNSGPVRVSEHERQGRKDRQGLCAQEGDRALPQLAMSLQEQIRAKCSTDKEREGD